MKPIHAFSSVRIATSRLPGPSAVIRIADERELLPPIHDADNAVTVLDCVFEDQDGGERAPTAADASQIATFVRQAEADNRIEHIIAQCQAGVGRSVAICAAVSASRNQRWENMAVYNRTMYDLLLAEFGRAAMPEPKVSLAVRVKYDTQSLLQFIISLRRQRYRNWEAVLFTDGPRPDVRELLAACPDQNLILMETPVRRGRWGHPYRQQAMQLCLSHGADWIGTNNDDNYLTPGYLEQLVMAGQRCQAQLSACSCAHRYSAWGISRVGDDLACWLARRELIQRVPWDGDDFLADQRYYQNLTQAAGGNVVEVPRVLVVKN